MNAVTLIGRLCNENELRYTANDNAILSNTIAVRRDAKNKDGEYESDFIQITLFGKTAEFLNNYSNKGDLICVIGKIRNDKYTNQEGETRYSQYVRVSNVELLTPKKKEIGESQAKEVQKTNQEYSIKTEQIEIDPDELPF